MDLFERPKGLMYTVTLMRGGIRIVPGMYQAAQVV